MKSTVMHSHTHTHTHIATQTHTQTHIHTHTHTKHTQKKHTHTHQHTVTFLPCVPVESCCINKNILHSVSITKYDWTESLNHITAHS